MSAVLIVDPDERQALEVAEGARACGFEAQCAATWHQALLRLADPKLRVILLDESLRKSQGRRALGMMRQLRPDLDLVMMVGRGSLRPAVEAMRLGAQDCLEKPVEAAQLKQVLSDCLKIHAIVDLRSQAERLKGADRILGGSFELMRAVRLARRVAAYPVSVLIQGESGTGKEIFAEAIHQMSGRAQGPFVAIDCSAYPPDLVESELFGFEKGAFTGADEAKPGRLELAEKGTLFIDSVGNVSPALQVKLLRVLQERRLRRLGSSKALPMDVRLICAATLPLKEAVASGRFREDLYHRINEFFIGLPPLRKRGGDVEILAHFFLRQFCAEFSKSPQGFSPEAMQRLKDYSWPGNVRELQSAIKRAVVLGEGRVDAAMLPSDLGAGPMAQSADDFTMPEGILPLWDARQSVSLQMERRAIEEALSDTRWNRHDAAMVLGMHPKTLGRKIKEQGLA